MNRSPLPIVAMLVAGLLMNIAPGAVEASVFLAGDGDNTIVMNATHLPSGANPRSYMAWVNVTENDLGPPRIGQEADMISHGSISSYLRSAFTIEQPTADAAGERGQVYLDFQVGYVRSAGISILDGKWHQVAATFDAVNGVAIYVDGIAVSTVEGVNGFNAGAVYTVNEGVASFGYGEFPAESARGGYFKGGIANASIWNRVLTPAEVLAAYKKGDVSDTTNGLIATVFGPLEAKCGRSKSN